MMSAASMLQSELINYRVIVQTSRLPSLRAIDAFCSPSAAMTLALASRVASASVAIARCICTGNRTSFTSTRSTFIPQVSV